MKKLIVAIAAICFATTTQAQPTSGKVVYKETIKLDIHLDGDMAAFAAMIPKEQIVEKELYYTPEVSQYQNAPEKKQDAAAEGGGGMRIMRMSSGGSEKTYRDLKEKKDIAQHDFMGRKFLVNGDVTKYDWKMTGKQKTILNYPCQEATTKRDTTIITAWFTPAIPLSTGPGSLNGLPGMILEVQMGANYTIEALSVSPGEVDTKILKKPTEGKKMTQAQYNAMMLEKTKEMREQAGTGGNGNVIINVRNH